MFHQDSTSVQQSRANRPALIAVAFAGVDLLAILIAMSRRIDLLHPIALYLALYAAAFLAYLYAVVKVIRWNGPPSRAILWLALGVGVACRLAMIHAVPSLSTDMYRYVWDGRLTCHWINPFRWSPWDPRLSAFRDASIWQPMEYKYYQTVYMPVSQLFFAIGYALFRNNLLGFKLMYAALDIGVMLLIAASLSKLGKDPARVIVYAWCPLPITEIALAGHQDVVGVFFLMLAFFLLGRGNMRMAAFSLAAAGLTKGFPLLLLPLFARYGGRRLLGIMVLGLIYLGLPIWVYLPSFLYGMQQYLGTVHVNGGLFTLCDTLLGFVTPLHFSLTSKLSDAAMLIAVGWSAWTRPVSLEDVARRSLVVLAVCLLAVPTLFPWYMVWLLPLVALYGGAPSASALCLAGLVDLVYCYYIDRAVHWWVQLVEYIPVCLLLANECRRGYWRCAPARRGVEGSTGASDMDNDGAFAGTAAPEAMPPTELPPLEGRSVVPEAT